jgi:hypothetical protein
MPMKPATHGRTPAPAWPCRLTLCAALLAPLPLPAQAPSTPPPFEYLDVNGDGNIDAQEAQQRGLPENLMRQADADRDRRASREEYRQWLERRADSRQRDATPESAPDAPPPRLVTGDERRRPPLATAPFDELDRDRDGVLGPDDARDLPAIRRNQVDDMDRDGDGRVQRSEFDQHQQRRAPDRTLDTPTLDTPRQPGPGL